MYNETMIHKIYLAGLIDGEGYLALLPSRNSALKVKSFEPVVKICMTGIESKIIFDQLIKQYGGHLETRSKLTTGGRIAYTYILKSKNKVAVLLDDIIDYLVIKQSQAKLLKEFCKLPSSHTRYASYDPKVVARKEELFNELKTLKRPAVTCND
jgi:hypothetical protein